MAKVKFRFIMTTILETENLDLIRDDIESMEFTKEPPDVLEIINKGTELFEETITEERNVKTFVRIDSI